ncbi:MAG: xanthine dehydrogenase family protein molybdopterin-binding subunit [Armatimonadetes bacterium]|nr:xanthine dehydrogenase family protein molybdopterin-binding subunit [Armatimonadota bacterium]
MIQTTQLSRRTFLQVVGVGGAGLALGCYTGPALAAGSDAESLIANAFVMVDPDGKVTITVARSEMGQGVRTSMAMIVAEQMDADWKHVVVVQAPGDGAKYGSQRTWGSQSTLSQYDRLSDMGAAARVMLTAAAAKKWDVEPATCRTDACIVYHDASGRSATYGELTEDAAKMPIPEEPKLKDKSEFKIIGQPLLRVDNQDVVTGKAIYTQDVQIPGAVHAVIERCPAFGGKLISFDDSAARKVDGVLDVIEVSNGVAVIAEHTWAAFQGRDALDIEWDLGPNATLDSAEINRRLRAEVKEHPSVPAGSKLVDATYDFPYLAHFTMEPQNAIAIVKAGSCEIWAPSQAPDMLQQNVSRSLDLPIEAVTIHVPLLGGGYGRRGRGDFAMEAVEVSKKIAKPVKLQWSREDDTRHDYYRPQSHHSLRGAVSAGRPVAWNHQMIKAGGRGGRGGAAPIPYAIEGASMVTGSAASSVPTGAWRAVDHGMIGPAVECFIDEMAVAAGKDPYEFRRDNLREMFNRDGTKDERMLNILNLVAEKSDWGKSMGENRGQGIACFDGYGCRIAHVVEVTINEYDEIKVDRVTIAIDPGLAINPKGVEAQLEGCCIDAISATLLAKITIRDGGVVEADPNDYLWARMYDSPKIEVHMINDTARPGGMGETGFPSMPAAIANAVFAATGKRVRKFPIVLDELV